MAEFFLEIFSEEIPARMQASGAAHLEGICAQVLKPLGFKLGALYYGPRRIALKAELAGEVAASAVAERGPRTSAPEQALAGFLRKHGAAREDLTQEGDFWVLNKQSPAQPAAAFIQSALPEALAKLPWPKSMRWGASGDFTWVRPLRGIISLLDGAVVPLQLGPVTSGNETWGHRVHGPGPFAVSSAAVWEEKLREHGVIADPVERREKIATGMAALAAAQTLSVAPDEGLLDEVTGLVEWPVPLLGRIDDDFMDLPPEVRELSMKINQKYFALRDADGRPAPHFAFVANLAAEDDGRAIIAGNERVLRARLADARHFWDLDLKTPLEDLLPKLEKITFHAKIGTQHQRAERISKLAGDIAALLQLDATAQQQARTAGLLAKADLVTGMVGEFPELQGIMGGYYATRSHGAVVGGAISTHYQPKGPSDAVPTDAIAIAVALADKLDTLIRFFAEGEKPTGSGDPYALRRAALGVIRIILENGLRLNLKPLLNNDSSLFDFIIERLRIKLRGEGKRFDILDAVLYGPSGNTTIDQLRIISEQYQRNAFADDDLVRLIKWVEALTVMLGTEDGKNLLAGYKRAANILRIESEKDQKLYSGDPDLNLMTEEAEKRLYLHVNAVMAKTKEELWNENYESVVIELASIRPYIDAFFEKVTVNAPEPELRRNRLRLLARFVGAVQQVADFTKIEG